MGRRFVILGACTLAIAVLFGVVVRQSWLTHSAAANVISLEEDGAELLHSMTSLLGDLVDAQSAAVRGEPIKINDIRTTIDGVGESHRLNGARLQVGQRVTDLIDQVEITIAESRTGRDAYVAYTSLVLLTVELIRRIGDTSHLIHDPDLDSYYLMEAVIVQLPDAVVLAGRASDLVTLAGGGALEGEDAVRAAVARFGVSAAAEAVSQGLNRSIDNTARAELGTTVTARLDAFKTAADAFAPPTMLHELSTAVDSFTLATNARVVSTTAGPLAHLLLSQLQLLLEDRAERQAAQWRFTLIMAILAGVVLVFMVWLLISVARRGRGSAGSDDGSMGLTSTAELALSGATRTRGPGRGFNGDAR